MKNLVKEIYDNAPKGWDWDFMSLDDVAKDAAVRHYVFKQGIACEIWPESCYGCEDFLTTSLYSDPVRFFLIFKTLVNTHGDNEQYKSEAIDEDDAAKLKAAVEADDCFEVVKIIGDIAYTYCESDIREACFDWKRTILQEEGEAYKAQEAADYYEWSRTA